MPLDLSWVAPQHAAKAEALVPVITEACERAERSTRFIAMQLNPKAEWRGWPTEVAEEWLSKRPSILLRYFNDEATTADVGRVLMARMHNVYQPSRGTGRVGRPPREPVPNLAIPEPINKTLDSVTWGVLWKSGASPDQASFVQAAKVPARADQDGEDLVAVLRSVGTVKGLARKARYVSISGDLYWSDVRNSLDLWIRARPELVESFTEWDEAGRPRAWQPGGAWLPVGSGRKEHNPLVHIKTTAWLRAMDIVTEWRREGSISLDALYDEGGDQAITDAIRPKPERRQHKPKPEHKHYAWGLRDRVDCYDFPVEHLAPDQHY